MKEIIVFKDSIEIVAGSENETISFQKYSDEDNRFEVFSNDPRIECRYLKPLETFNREVKVVFVDGKEYRFVFENELLDKYITRMWDSLRESEEQKSRHYHNYRYMDEKYNKIRNNWLVKFLIKISIIKE